MEPEINLSEINSVQDMKKILENETSRNAFFEQVKKLDVVQGTLQNRLFAPELVADFAKGAYGPDGLEKLKSVGLKIADSDFLSYPHQYKEVLNDYGLNEIQKEAVTKMYSDIIEQGAAGKSASERILRYENSFPPEISNAAKNVRDEKNVSDVKIDNPQAELLSPKESQKKGFLERAGNWLKNTAEKVAEVVNDVVSITPPAILVKYWAEGWRNLPQALGIKDSDAKDHNIKLTDVELQQAEGRVHEEFKYITFISKYHGKAEDLNNLNEKEKEYIGDKFKKEEVVGFIEDEKTGLRAAAIKDAEGKINIVIAGGDLKNGFKPLKKDIDDVFLSTAGDETTQLEPLLNFAREMKEKHGSVDKITGHSLGGHLAFGLVPEFPNAQVTTFDAPGMSDAYAHDLAQRYNKTPDDIKKSYDKDVYRIRVNDNAYNTLGWSPVDVTMGEKASRAIDDHFMGDGKNGKGYEAKVMALGSKVGNEKADLQNDDITNNTSIGPIGISGLMVASTVPLLAGSTVVAGATVVAGTSAIIKKGMNEPNGFTTKESEFYDRVKEELSADGKLDREDKRLLKDIKAQLSESGVQYDKMEGLADRVVARVAAGVKPEQEATKGIK